MWLLIQKIGNGTAKLADLPIGSTVNLLFPLGNHFALPTDNQSDVLLVGGGVGVAPLLMLGAELKDYGYSPTFLLGARSKSDLLELELFAEYGEVYTTTEDGSLGEKGYVTNHSILKTAKFDKIYTCGPTPMMKAIASYADKNSIECEVSLENTMACGIGACLCCVQDTKSGHKCVCTEGPVFNINDLKWQI
jgi:dihydroorotate dehydrogenase electron transfer subunit